MVRAAVVAADHHRDTGPAQSEGTGLARRPCGRLPSAGFGLPVSVGKAEIPVFDVMAAAVPLVGPGKDESARAAAAKAVRICQSSTCACVSSP